MEETNTNEKTVQEEAVVSDDEKTLEQLLLDKNYEMTPSSVSSIVLNTRTLKNFNSDVAAKEYLKQLVIDGEDITKYLQDSKIELQNNHNQKILSKLKTMTNLESESYRNLISPFVKEKNISEPREFKDKFKLKFYDVFNLFDKEFKLIRQIKQKNIISSFEKIKFGIEDKLLTSNNRKSTYSNQIKTTKTKLSDMINNLNLLYSDISFSNKAVKKLEYEKSELQNLLEDKKTENINYSEINNSINSIDVDLQNIQENALENLEDADNLKLRIVDSKIDLQEKEQLYYFYKDMFTAYRRRFQTISDLSLKLEKGLSFKSAYEEAKEFIDQDSAFTQLDTIKKEQYKKQSSELLRLKMPHMRESLPELQFNRKQLDYKLRISEGLDDLKNFMVEVQKY